MRLKPPDWRAASQRLRTLGAMCGLALGLVCAAPAGMGGAAEPVLRPELLAAPPAACAVEPMQRLLGPDVHVAAAAAIPATAALPSHCLVTGAIQHDGPIGFALGLPDHWNRKYLFLGIGGFSGRTWPLDEGLARGYATASTDTGHVDSPSDARFALNNPAAVRNHFEVAVELAAVDLKSAAAAYYGAIPRHAYWDGCSGGGRQGLIEAQRFPDAFDGVIAAAPAWNYAKLLMMLAENANMVVNSPAKWIPPEMFPAIDREVLRQCDGIDGVVDGIIMDPRACRPDLRRLRCAPGHASPTCLTAAQMSALDEIRRPPFARPGSGYHGYFLSGAETVDSGWSFRFFGPRPPTVRRGAPFDGALNGRLGTEFVRYIVHNDPNYDWRRFSIARDGPAVERALASFTDASQTDMSPFFRRGGKLLIWHGWSDGAIPPEMSIDLYQRILRDSHGGWLPATAEQSVRLFMVPGMHHCDGGSGLTRFDTLTALENWVERSAAPESIVGTQVAAGRPMRSRPICAYPKVARFRGGERPDDAESFECR